MLILVMFVGVFSSISTSVCRRLFASSMWISPTSDKASAKPLVSSKYLVFFLFHVLWLRRFGYLTRMSPGLLPLEGFQARPSGQRLSRPGSCWKVLKGGLEHATKSAATATWPQTSRRKWMDGRMNGRMDGLIDGWTDQWTNGWMDGWCMTEPCSLCLQRSLHYLCSSSICVSAPFAFFTSALTCHHPLHLSSSLHRLYQQPFIIK